MCDADGTTGLLIINCRFRFQSSRTVQNAFNGSSNQQHFRTKTQLVFPWKEKLELCDLSQLEKKHSALCHGRVHICLAKQLIKKIEKTHFIHVVLNCSVRSTWPIVLLNLGWLCPMWQPPLSLFNDALSPFNRDVSSLRVTCHKALWALGMFLGREDPMQTASFRDCAMALSLWFKFDWRLITFEAAFKSKEGMQKKHLPP